MRKSTSKTRRLDKGFDLGGSLAPAVRIHRADPLSLPVLVGVKAPSVVLQSEAMMALWLLKAGYLDESQGDLSPGGLVKAGFERWSNKWLGETPNMAELQLGYNLDYGLNEEDEWVFSIELPQPLGIRLLEPRFNEIEPRAPGLFQTALATIEAVMWRIAPPGTPGAIRDLLGNSVWCGNATEEDFRDEMFANGCTEEDMEGMLTPAMFDQELPSWIIDPKAVLKKNQLKALARQSDLPEIAAIARSVIALDALGKDIETFEVGDAYPVYSLALMRWNPNDECIRGYDDYIQRANECADAYTTSIVEEFVPRREEDFNTLLKRVQPALRGIKLTNELVGLLSIPDDSQ